MYRRIVLLSLALSLLVNWPIRSHAEVAPSPTPPPAAVIQPGSSKAFDPAAATQAWLDTVPADKREKSDRYFEGGYWLLLWNFLLTGAIALFLLESGLSARLRDFAERRTRFKGMQIVFYAVPFLLIVAVLGFPLQVYEGFFREHQYGLATQTFGPWLVDQLKGLLVGMIGLSIALPILYAVFRHASRSWWLWATCVVVALSLAANFLAPVYIFPLFNKYTPLTDPNIRDPILAMAKANEIPVQQVFVVDASRQTTRVSANVAGAFGTSRIALNDNLLNKCTLPEIRQVMGHEMGHYVLNHQGKLATYSGILFLITFGLISLLFGRAQEKWGQRWGVRGVSDIAGLPLLWLLLAVISFLTTPLQNSVGRITEREADAFGLNLAREPDGFAMVSLKLGSYRKLNPGPIEEFIFFDHPSGRARIRMAMDWKAEQLPAGELAGK